MSCRQGVFACVDLEDFQPDTFFSFFFPFVLSFLVALLLGVQVEISYSRIPQIIKIETKIEIDALLSSPSLSGVLVYVVHWQTDHSIKHVHARPPVLSLWGGKHNADAAREYRQKKRDLLRMRKSFDIFSRKQHGV